MNSVEINKQTLESICKMCNFKTKVFLGETFNVEDLEILEKEGFIKEIVSFRFNMYKLLQTGIDHIKNNNNAE